jgi:hypothetical protein
LLQSQFGRRDVHFVRIQGDRQVLSSAARARQGALGLGDLAHQLLALERRAPRLEFAVVLAQALRLQRAQRLLLDQLRLPHQLQIRLVGVRPVGGRGQFFRRFARDPAMQPAGPILELGDEHQAIPAHRHLHQPQRRPRAFGEDVVSGDIDVVLSDERHTVDGSLASHVVWGVLGEECAHGVVLGHRWL